MSIVHSKIEVDRFLATDLPEVLVIAGNWGVGKTYAWKRYLSSAYADQQVALKKYAYVSLFGLSSLKEVKDAIFQNSVLMEASGRSPDFSTFEAGLTTIKSNWRSGGAWAAMLPASKSYATIVASMGFFSLKEQIICIDDLERRGASIDIRDVLGLVSQLKEEKACKVVLLLNDRELGKDEAQYQSQLEKVADTLIRFEPTAEEATTIGLDGSQQFHEFLKTNCVALNIVNIRTVKKWNDLPFDYLKILRVSI